MSRNCYYTWHHDSWGTGEVAMFADVTAIRLLCLMLVASGAYCLWWPTPTIGNLFQRAPLPKSVDRLIGWVSLVAAVVLFTATFVWDSTS
jgi:hypothetical protein